MHHTTCSPDERGITTAEYAVGTAAGAGLAGLLYKMLTGGFGNKLLTLLYDHVLGLLASREPMTSVRRRAERGAATAELAMVLPLLVAVAIGLVWLLAVGSAQVRAVDAARETARALARGDDEAAAVARGLQVAPPGSRVHVSRGGGEVRVTCDRPRRGARRPAGGDARAPAPRRGGRRRRGGGLTVTRPPEQGSATLFAVAVGVLCLVGAGPGVVASMVYAHRVAQSAADLSAIAGAQARARGRDPCGAAAALAKANGAVLDSCVVEGLDVRVSPTVTGPHWLGQHHDLSAQALAGPA